MTDIISDTEQPATETAPGRGTKMALIKLGFVGAAGIVAVTALTGCGGAGEAAPLAAAPKTVTKTITVTQPPVTVTQPPVTITPAPVTVTKTKVATELDPAPLTTAAPAPGQSPSGSDFDRAYAITVAHDTMYEIRTVDYRLRDGIAVSSALYLLSDDYDRLTDAGTPPGADPAKYQARLRTLASFTSDAADVYAGNPMLGETKYTVAREQTALVFEALNAALGTDFKLP